MQLTRRGFFGTLAAGFAALAVGRLPKLLKKETVVHLDWFRFMRLKGKDTAAAECRWRVQGEDWQRKLVKMTKRQTRFYLADNVWIDCSLWFGHDDLYVHDTFLVDGPVAKNLHLWS